MKFSGKIFVTIITLCVMFMIVISVPAQIYAQEDTGETVKTEDTEKTEETESMEEAGTSFNQGLELYYQKKWGDSMEFFKETFQKDPLDTMSLSFYMGASYKNNELIQTVNKIEQATIEGGNTPILRAHLGIAYMSRGFIEPDMLDEALSQLKGALKDNPDLSVANTGMGMLYFRKRLIPRAKGYFIKALKSNENDLMAIELLGNILLIDEKNPEVALEFFQKLIQLSPNYSDGYFMAGSACQRMDKKEEAIKYFQTCMEKDPMGVMKGYDAPLRMGDIYLGEQNYDEAIKYYKKALKINPENPYAKTMLEKAEARGKQWKGEKYDPMKDKIKD
ncbi:MAG: tetratricopeptide repeat protein [Candidatus Eremiobacteraeota bacterium]|nr:tetratricopeptide repeat protein [Candidatus Eremiobacteraeota bacterium]